MTHVAQTLLSALLHPAELTCCSRAHPERLSKARESDGKTGALLRPSVASVVGVAFPITRAYVRFRAITGDLHPSAYSVFQRCWGWFLNFGNSGDYGNFFASPCLPVQFASSLR